MTRAPYLIVGLLLAAVFAWQSCQALVREPAHAKASPAEDDYPLEEGLTWVYKSSTGLQVVRRVVKSSGEGFEMQFDLPFIGRKTLPMQRTPEGVAAMRAGKKQLIMKFPMKPGDAWTIDFPEEDLAECTVLDPEEIDVLKNRVLASKLRVVRTNRKSGRKTTDYEWYARGIGLVRMEVTFGLTATFILERFEKAK